MKKIDVIVIGAGAAGLMAAGQAARAGKQVLVLERNKHPGRKLLLTGKGRCNVTNNCDIDTLIQNTYSGGRFLYSAFSRFTPQDLMDFFISRGIPLKTERGRRVFPQSDRSADILNALLSDCNNQNCQIIQARAESLLIRDGILSGVTDSDKKEHIALKVIVATGGMSYPATGSTGDGYRLAKQAGHIITPPRPSLVPLEARENWCGELAGLSLKNVTLTVFAANKLIFQEMGELLFTHFGLSGPLVLSASAHMKQQQDYTLSIDLKPALTPEQLDKRFQRDFSETPNKDFSNALNKLLPASLIPVMITLSGIKPDTKVHQITKPMRLQLGVLFKNLPLTFKRFRPIKEAVITSGGVSLKEIDPKTMQSKLLSGLYFAGEVLDADAYTGGYNLQIAFSTAVAAAMGDL